MSALDELTIEAMACGTGYFTEAAERGEIDASFSWTEVFGSFASQFLQTRTDLVEAVRAEMKQQ